MVPTPRTQHGCCQHQDAPEHLPPQAWGHGTDPYCLTAHHCPALPWPGHGRQVGDSALLPQDLICVLIDDGGFLVLSNQEDHWYQVSSNREAALLGVGCQQGAETFELMSWVG